MREKNSNYRFAEDGELSGEARGARYRIRLPCHDMNRGTNMVEGIKYARRVNRGLAIKVSQ